MTPLTFFIGFIIVAIALLAMGYGAVKWSRMCLKQAHEYEAYYEKLSKKVNNWTINKPNYNILMSQLKTLGSMKWKDRDKTEELFILFLHRFKDEANKSVNE